MRYVVAMLIALCMLSLAIVYDNVDSRITALEEVCNEPQPLVRIYQVRHSTAKVYVGGEEVYAPND